MRPRVREAADIVLAAKIGISRADVARTMGCKPSTAQQYLHEAKSFGLVMPSGRGCKSLWVPAGVTPPPRGSKERVASVWGLAA